MANNINQVDSSSLADNTSDSSTSFHSVVIAGWFLNKQPTMKDDVMKVLKLVYIAHGFHLAFLNKPLVKETIHAWQYGPVIPELYFRLKTDRLDTYIHEEEVSELNKSKEILNILEAVYSKYGKLSGMQLSILTHEKNTPWDTTVNNFESEITNEIIKAYYKDLIKQ